MVFAIDGILHLMVQNVQNHRLLKELFTLDPPKSTPIVTKIKINVTATLKATNQVPKGHVRVGFWIGKCQGTNLGDGSTGWNSMSRIVIEEVPPPQD